MSPRLIEATNYDLFVLVLWQITVIVEYDDRSSWGACWATDDDKPVYQSVWGRCSAVFYKQVFELQKRHVFINPICGWSIQIGVQLNVFEKPILPLGRLDWAWRQSPAAKSLELIVVDCCWFSLLRQSVLDTFPFITDLVYLDSELILFGLLVPNLLQKVVHMTLQLHNGFSQVAVKDVLLCKEDV